MSDKQRFSFLIRSKEREVLRRLSEAMDRSEGAVLRTLIRQAERSLMDAVLPLDNLAHKPPRAEVCHVQN
jgi:hypothetical protein